MKFLRTILSICIIALMLMPATVQAGKKNIKEVKFLTSAHCWKSCEEKLEGNIKFEKGVTFVDLDLNTKICTIKYKKNKTNPEKLRKAIVKLGFQAKEIKPQKKKS